MTFCYLASPYTHVDPTVMEHRYEQACAAAARLMESGVTVFAPIPHSVAVAQHLPPARNTDFEFWMKQDLPILRCASKLIVLCLPGWEKSRGVTEEIRVAKECGIPVEYMA